MAQGAHDEHDVRWLLEATREPGSPSWYSLDEVRDFLLETLAFHDEELAQRPHLAQVPYWNLTMKDYCLPLDAFFVVAVFQVGHITLFAGLGNEYAVKRVDGDPEEIEALVRSQFRVPHPSLTLDRETVKHWLGREGGQPI